jgi:hypothetical protein
MVTKTCLTNICIKSKTTRFIPKPENYKLIMKLILKTSVLFLICNIALAQLQLGGITLPGGAYNTFYNGSNYSLGVPLQSSTGLPWSSLIPDAGTNMYSIDNNFNYNGSPDYYIIRQGNKWRIGSIWTYFATGYTWELSYPSSSIDPPCSALWIRQSATFSGGPINTPTGDLDLLTLTDLGIGSCFFSPPPILCGVSTLCEGMQYPQLSTTQINNITTAQPGFLTYNSLLNSFSWYDGLSWKNMYNGIGDFSVGGNISTTGNATISGNLANSGTLNSGGSIITNDDVIIKGSNQLIFQDALPSTSYANTIGTTTGGLDYNFTIDGNTIMNIKQSELAITGGIKTAQVSTFNSGIKYPITTSSTSTSLTSSNYMVIFTGSTANCTLPAPSSANKGQVYKIINHGSGSITFNLSITTGSSSVSTLGTNSILEMISDGFVWRKIN